MWLGGMEEGVRVRERQWERVCVRAYVCVCVCVCVRVRCTWVRASV